MSLLLTFVAGFTDATTFIAADKLFSAHVTGNFIVLAYDLIHGADHSEWSKLLAFPVFVGAVLLAGVLDRRAKNPLRLLRLEGLLLLGAGLAAWVLRWVEPAGLVAGGMGWPGLEYVAGGGGRTASGFVSAGIRPALEIALTCIEMTMVVAMAFQNAYGRLYPKTLYGPTTVMTGNVTSAALDILPALLIRPYSPEKRALLRQNAAIIGVFLLGCVAGALLGYRFGLGAAVLPGLLLIGYFCYI